MTISRRRFLSIASSVPVAAMLAAEDLGRRIFLPPRGGWPALDGLASIYGMRRTAKVPVVLTCTVTDGACIETSTTVSQAEFEAAHDYFRVVAPDSPPLYVWEWDRDWGERLVLTNGHKRRELGSIFKVNADGSREIVERRGIDVTVEVV